MNPTALPPNALFEVLGALHTGNRAENKVSIFSELDASSMLATRANLLSREGWKPSITSLVVRAVSMGLAAHPYANRICIQGFFRPRMIQLNTVDVAVAVARDEPGREMAAYAEILRNTDTRRLLSIQSELKQIARAAPDSRPQWRNFNRLIEQTPRFLSKRILTLPERFPRMWVEHRGGAALVTAPTRFGGDGIIGTWPWPLTFSVGHIKKRPWVSNNRLGISPTMMLALSFDRRLLAGGPAGRFFNHVVEILEHAETRMRDFNQDTPTGEEQPEINRDREAIKDELCSR